MARPRDATKPAQIIEAAFAVFGQRGYEATRISHIADRAGISTGTVYTYFKDKEDLFRATVEEGWRRFLHEIEEISGLRLSAQKRLFRAFDAGLEALKTYLPLLRGMLFESSQMNILQGNLDKLCSYFVGLVEELAGERESAADIKARRTRIRLTVHGVLFTAALLEPSKVDDLVVTLKRMFRRFIRGA